MNVRLQPCEIKCIQTRKPLISLGSLSALLNEIAGVRQFLVDESRLVYVDNDVAGGETVAPDLHE